MLADCSPLMNAETGRCVLSVTHLFRVDLAKGYCASNSRVQGFVFTWTSFDLRATPTSKYFDGYCSAPCCTKRRVNFLQVNYLLHYGLLHEPFAPPKHSLYGTWLCHRFFRFLRAGRYLVRLNILSIEIVLRVVRVYLLRLFLWWLESLSSAGRNSLRWWTMQACVRSAVLWYAF